MAHTEEAKAKMSAAKKGKKFTEEHRAALSAAKKGIKRAPEVCAKIAASHTGLKHSEETLAKISEAKIKYAAYREKMTGFKYNMDDSHVLTSESRQYQKPDWLNDKCWTEFKTNQMLFKLIEISLTKRNLWQREKDWINALFKNIVIEDHFTKSFEKDA